MDQFHKLELGYLLYKLLPQDNIYGLGPLLLILTLRKLHHIVLVQMVKTVQMEKMH